MSLPTYRDNTGCIYTLDDLTAGDDEERIAAPADARAIDALKIGEGYTIDLGASGLVALTRSDCGGW